MRGGGCCACRASSADHLSLLRHDAVGDLFCLDGCEAEEKGEHDCE